MAVQPIDSLMQRADQLGFPAPGQAPTGPIGPQAPEPPKGGDASGFDDITPTSGYPAPGGGNEPTGPGLPGSGQDSDKPIPPTTTDTPPPPRPKKMHALRRKTAGPLATQEPVMRQASTQRTRMTANRP